MHCVNSNSCSRSITAMAVLLGLLVWIRHNKQEMTHTQSKCASHSHAFSKHLKTIALEQVAAPYCTCTAGSEDSSLAVGKGWVGSLMGCATFFEVEICRCCIWLLYQLICIPAPDPAKCVHCHLHVPPPFDHIKVVFLIIITNQSINNWMIKHVNKLNCYCQKFVALHLAARDNSPYFSLLKLRPRRSRCWSSRPLRPAWDPTWLGMSKRYVLNQEACESKDSLRDLYFLFLFCPPSPKAHKANT